MTNKVTVVQPNITKANMAPALRRTVCAFSKVLNGSDLMVTSPSRIATSHPTILMHSPSLETPHMGEGFSLASHRRGGLQIRSFPTPFGG